MAASLPYRPCHARNAAWLLDQARRNNGLAPLDLDRFWADQEVARKDPFGRAIPQLPLGITMSWECVFDELGVPEDHWKYQNDDEWALGLARAYNDKAEAVVGTRLIGELRGDPARHYPAVKGLHDVFEARHLWQGSSWWLQQSARSTDELEALLDRVEQRDIRSFILPDNWHEEKERLTKLGVKPPLYRGQRGPVTFACSIFGAENLVYLILDKPEIAARFRDAIIRSMLAIARVLDEEAGYTAETSPRGFSFCDDNCCLLNPDMYEFFGYPVLRALFDRYAPAQGDWRFQHSDSAMGHLLPVLSRLEFSAVNLGPTLTVEEIRAHLPRTQIHGQLAPFTFSRNEEEKMLLELFRDFEMSMAARGVLFSTAGSINNGSRLTGMRLLMSAIQHFCRY